MPSRRRATSLMLTQPLPTRLTEMVRWKLTFDRCIIVWWWYCKSITPSLLMMNKTCTFAVSRKIDNNNFWLKIIELKRYSANKILLSCIPWKSRTTVTTMGCPVCKDSCNCGSDCKCGPDCTCCQKSCAQCKDGYVESSLLRSGLENLYR